MATEDRLHLSMFNYIFPFQDIQGLDPDIVEFGEDGFDIASPDHESGDPEEPEDRMEVSSICNEDQRIMNIVKIYET